MISEKKGEPLGKRHNWITNKNYDIMYEILVWENGRRLDRFIWSSSKRFKEILELIRLKFGMDYK